jgi:hypothetical protein
MIATPGQLGAIESYFLIRIKCFCRQCRCCGSGAGSPEELEKLTTLAVPDIGFTTGDKWILLCF